MNPPVAGARPRNLTPLLPAALALGCLVWAFWTTFLDLAEVWRTNAQYSHGYLVPAFAVLLLWLRRDRLDAAALRCSWWGLPLLLGGVGLRLYGVYVYRLWYDHIALLPCLAGICLLLGGRAAWRWAWPSVLFLAFMVPLPFRADIALAGPLQRLATITSTFIMQVVGLPALAEGNIIKINDAEIGIVEACSGLRMLVVFFALSAAVALIIRRPLVDKLLIVASAVPIALVSNIIRVTATGILHETVDSATANAFFHDFAGWLMMPLALGMLALELKLLSHLLVEVPVAKPRPPRDPALRRTVVQRPARTRRPAPPRKKQQPPAPAAPPAVEQEVRQDA